VAGKGDAALGQVTGIREVNKVGGGNHTSKKRLFIRMTDDKE
jgi:hypothetical protein